MTDLEIGLAHIQRLYEQLNEVVTEQALQSDRMRRQIEALTKQVKASKEKGSEQAFNVEDEKPPHY